MMKHPWLSRMPIIPAPNSLSLSIAGTCSLGEKKEVSQNSKAAPAMRKSTIIIGASTPDANTSFATGDISPQHTLAPSIAACPFKLKSPIFFIVQNHKTRIPCPFGLQN